RQRQLSGGIDDRAAPDELLVQLRRPVPEVRAAPEGDRSLPSGLEAQSAPLGGARQHGSGADGRQAVSHRESDPDRVEGRAPAGWAHPSSARQNPFRAERNSAGDRKLSGGGDAQSA